MKRNNKKENQLKKNWTPHNSPQKERKSVIPKAGFMKRSIKLISFFVD